MDRNMADAFVYFFVSNISVILCDLRAFARVLLHSLAGNNRHLPTDFAIEPFF